MPTCINRQSDDVPHSSQYFLYDSSITNVPIIFESINGLEDLIDLSTWISATKWTILDTGNFDALHQASSYIRTHENRQGLKVGCPEELAWRFGLISKEELISLVRNQLKSGYGKYLLKVVESDTRPKII